ncbi:MAG TPA: glycosyltransferase [Candidatus Acidoferrales bacterium]|nr:glycosyltransferase [Candidatus Acidoferrales bacterium]
MDEGTLPRGLSRLRRVAVISLHTSPTAKLGEAANGGLNVYVREVCCAFSQRGIATDVFTRRLDPDAPAIEELAPLSRVVYLPAGSPELDKYRLFDEVEPFARRLAAFARRQKIEYDLLYSHYWLSGAVACTLHGRLRVPWAHTAHTLGLVKNRRLAPGARPEPELRLQLEAEISRAADLLVVSTAAEGEDVVRGHSAHPARVTVVSPGIDLERFRPLDRAEARRQLDLPPGRTLLFVGRLERLKGVELALRAFALVVREHPDVRLLVVGEDSHESEESEKARLRGIAAELGILDQVEFRGPIPQERLPAYYSAAEACLMPSYSESFGLVGLEAQACGCPVVASDAAGISSVVRDGLTGFLVGRAEPAEYADRLRRLLDQPAEAIQIGRRASLLAQRFSWSGTADRLEAAFRELGAGYQLRVQAGSRQEYGNSAGS